MSSKQPLYVSPRIETLEAQTILEALGPVSAASGAPSPSTDVLNDPSCQGRLCG